MADIIHRIGIKAPAARVYEAVATPQGVAGWWTRDTSGGGARIGVRFLHKDGTEIGHMDFELAKLEPNREVRWRFRDGPPEWIGTDATFQLTQEDTSILVLGHRNWKEPVEFMAHCSMKRAVFLLSLKQLVETGTGQPAPDDLKIDNWN